MDKKKLNSQKIQLIAIMDMAITDITTYKADIERIERDGPSSFTDVVVIKKCLNFCLGAILKHEADMLELSNE